MRKSASSGVVKAPVMAKCGINEMIFVLLLSTVLFQTFHLASRSMNNHSTKRELQRMHSSYSHGSSSADQQARRQAGDPAPGDQEHPVWEATLGQYVAEKHGHQNNKRNRPGNKDPGAGNAHGPKQVEDGRELARMSNRKGGLSRLTGKDKGKTSSRIESEGEQRYSRDGEDHGQPVETRVVGSDVLGGGGKVELEAISADEAQEMAENAARAAAEQEQDVSRAEQQEDEEQADEEQEDIEAGDSRARPVTLGGEPQWSHISSGAPGGIGAPKVFNVEPLYFLDNRHFHLHQKQFETDGMRGGWMGDNGKPRSAILRYPVTLPDGKESFEQTQFSSEDLDLLPYNDSHWTFSSCAIVSNSGSLLNAEFGSEIDAHEMITRINHAPVAGFNRYVGSRTTFDICNRPHAHRLSKISVLRKNEKASLVLFESLNWNVYYRLYKHLFKAFPFPGTVVLSPDLMLSMLDLWKKLAMKFPEQAYSCRAIARAAGKGQDSKRCHSMKHDCDSTICKPSSGFFALVFAAQMCNRITMFGFEAYRFNSHMAKSTKYHYFDDETGTTNVHSFVLLMKVFKYLSQHYPITIRTSAQGQLDVEDRPSDPHLRRHLAAERNLTQRPDTLWWNK